MPSVQRISQVQRDRRIADERELSDSEDEEGDRRRDHSEAKQIAKKRKTSSEAVNGTLEVPPVALTVTQTTEETTTVAVVAAADEKSVIVTENNVETSE